MLRKYRIPASSSCGTERVLVIHQYLQEPEGTRHGDEEVACHDRSRMIFQERRPALVPAETSRRPANIIK